MADHQLLFNDLACMLNAIFTNMSFLPGNKNLYFIAAASAKRTV
jgi:hypothetical protein